MAIGITLTVKPNQLPVVTENDSGVLSIIFDALASMDDVASITDKAIVDFMKRDLDYDRLFIIIDENFLPKFIIDALFDTLLPNFFTEPDIIP